MKIIKEIITKKYMENATLVEITKQFHYDSAKERAEHIKEMKRNGYENNGQAEENIGSFNKPEYVWFGSFCKTEVAN